MLYRAQHMRIEDVKVGVMLFRPSCVNWMREAKRTSAEDATSHILTVLEKLSNVPENIASPNAKAAASFSGTLICSSTRLE